LFYAVATRHAYYHKTKEHQKVTTCRDSGSAKNRETRYMIA